MQRNPNREVKDYRHDSSKRKNNPPAGIAGQGRTPETPKQEYAYNPHLPPILRSDPNGDVDELHDLLQKAQHQTLTPEEAEKIADALKHYEPWLEWAGKQEAKSFTVDPVALHKHEHVSAKAILKVAARENVQRELFADPQQTYDKALEFYRHDVDWTNRLILGDSLMVMSSLAHREDLAGKVQMIYIDPPYGIKFSSNFQPTVFQRDVKDRDQDLTREPEQIKAYRDTWTLGIHSYLAYLRDRLIVAKDLLTDSGSIFVQISDENVHRIRTIMDEVFGNENFVGEIIFKTRSTSTRKNLSILNDYILWYCKDISEVKCHRLYEKKGTDSVQFNFADIDGEIVKASDTKKFHQEGAKYFLSAALFSTSGSDTSRIPFLFRKKEYLPAASLSRGWRCSQDGLRRLAAADRLICQGNSIRYKYYYNDYPYTLIANLWDTQMSEQNKSYVVQTSTKVIERCLLMTTDPGDLVLDPTCGSGTAAYVAERWGRRWITIDTSRVSIVLARQRLLTSTFEYYKFKDEAEGVVGGFINKRVPHIMLKSIANNTALDPIFEKYEPILTEKLETLNNTLADITPDIRTKLLAKLVEKERRDGKRSITDADRRRWELPETTWQEWEVPFDTDPDWTEALQDALTDYRKAWRAKMDEVNKCIADASDGEELVDQPEVDRKRIRVSGPFTVEAVQPPEEYLDMESPIGGEPDDLDNTFDDTNTVGHEDVNAEAYLDKMIHLLREDGVKFPDDKKQKFATLEPLEAEVLHAEGTWENEDSDHRVAVAFGPQHGPVTVIQVEDCLPIASRLGYDELVFAGFSFDGAAQTIIQNNPNPRVHIHMANINPDVVMGDLLKNTSTSQLFTVFGLPRTKLEKIESEESIEYTITMEGVDIYNPVDNTVSSAGADKVAAWFVDSDYDGRTFCITQAFFPDKKAWSRIARDLRGVIDTESFEMFSGTVSLPFPAGEHACVAVKVIDPRGNEVMRVHDLER